MEEKTPIFNQYPVISPTTTAQTWRAFQIAHTTPPYLAAATRAVWLLDFDSTTAVCRKSSSSRSRLSLCQPLMALADLPKPLRRRDALDLLNEAREVDDEIWVHLEIAMGAAFDP